MSYTAPQTQLMTVYSIALLCCGIFFSLGALLVAFNGSAGEEVAEAFQFVSSILLLLGLSCIAVALLRWVRAPMALPATAGLSLFLLVGFPVGTALAIYWMTSVRDKELAFRTDHERISFRYTSALYILGLLMANVAIVFRTLLISSDSEDQWLWRAFMLGAFGLASAFIVVGALRSINFRWAHWATLALNVVLILWFPLGTALSLIWFFAVRKHERRILLGEEFQPVA